MVLGSEESHADEGPLGLVHDRRWIKDEEWGGLAVRCAVTLVHMCCSQWAGVLIADCVCKTIATTHMAMLTAIDGNVERVVACAIVDLEQKLRKFLVVPIIKPITAVLGLCFFSGSQNAGVLEDETTTTRMRPRLRVDPAADAGRDIHPRCTSSSGTIYPY